jgi:hypothetical protein
MRIKPPPHPKTYFDAVKDYQTAADHLMAGVKGLTTFNPAYFLYAPIPNQLDARGLEGAP